MRPVESFKETSGNHRFYLIAKTSGIWYAGIDLGGGGGVQNKLFDGNTNQERLRIRKYGHPVACGPERSGLERRPAKIRKRADARRHGSTSV